jgi:hypothetical protein
MAHATYMLLKSTTSADSQESLDLTRHSSGSVPDVASKVQPVQPTPNALRSIVQDIR